MHVCTHLYTSGHRRFVSNFDSVITNLIMRETCRTDGEVPYHGLRWKNRFWCEVVSDTSEELSTQGRRNESVGQVALVHFSLDRQRQWKQRNKRGDDSICLRVEKRAASFNERAYSKLIRSFVGLSVCENPFPRTFLTKIAATDVNSESRARNKGLYSLASILPLFSINASENADSWRWCFCRQNTFNENFCRSKYGSETWLD